MKKLPIILMVIVWAGYYISSKFLVDLTGSPFVTGMLLRGSALIIYTVALIITKEFKQLFKVKGIWPILITIGILGFVLDASANLGFRYSSLSTGTIILKTDVLIVNLVSVIIFSKRLRGTDWVFSLIMLLGVMLTLNIDYKTLSFNPYDLLFLLSATAVSVNAFYIKWAQTKKNISANVIGYYNNLTVFILFTIIVLTRGESINITGSAGLVVVIVGGIMQCLIYVTYYFNLKKHEVWIVKVFLLFVPVVSTLWGILIYKESITPITLLGMAAVLLGALGIILLRRKEEIKTEGSI